MGAVISYIYGTNLDLSNLATPKQMMSISSALQLCLLLDATDGQGWDNTLRAT